MRIQATETSAPPAGLPLSIARLAFRRSADCNTESGGAASNIAGIAIPKLRFQFLFRAVFSDWAVHNRPAGCMCRLLFYKCFSSQKPPAFFGAFILQKIFRKNQCADCSFIGICRKRVRTLRFVLSFPSCNAGYCVFFEYCLMHTRQNPLRFLLPSTGLPASAASASGAAACKPASAAGGSLRRGSHCLGSAVHRAAHKMPHHISMERA